ncbi:hypothetical protein ACQR10_04480 [Bradyrhizobium sp. HKCCYLRH2060]|uniref:hypothetical protein n=1 Tax=Bradyrhizobium sp. HKCCYLRH2060 TaxID=3420743 RepID=UPI003EBBF53E
MTKKKEGARPCGKPWTAAEVATAARIWKEMVTDIEGRGSRKCKAAAWAAIGEAIGRSAMAVKDRYRDCGVGYVSRLAGAQAQSMARLDPAVAASRDALLRARAQQPSISAWLNDPPPGYSALDQRGGDIRR